jgi:glycosyltransferase involved in cell wall biosynthesis
MKSCQRLIFITPNEQEYFKLLAGDAPGDIILNPSISPGRNLAPHPAVPKDNRLKIASLKSFSPNLGHQRLVEIAKELAVRGAENKVLFIMAGDMRLWSSLPGKMGEIGARGGDFGDYVNDLGLTQYFKFPGWVPDPENLLASCDLLAAPGVENNPWGRDIIEACSLGKPVLATGTWDTFIKDGETGFLSENFDASQFAENLLYLADDRDRLKRMGEAGQKNITKLCSPPDRAHDLLKVWRSLVN